MANLSYLWQLVSSMEDAAERLGKSPNEKKSNEVAKLKSFIFDLHKKVDAEVKKVGK